MGKMETAAIRSGALSLALHTSRIAGLAPLSFRKLRNGYIISISRFQLAYSFFVITVFNVIGLAGLYLNIKNKWLDDIQSDSMTVLVISERMMYILGCGVGYMGAIRMKNMIYHINILEKIRTKINYGYHSAKEDINVMWISCLINILGVISTLLEMTFAIFQTSDFDIGDILLAIQSLEYNIFIILKIQIVVINFEVYKVLLELNAKLRYIITLADSDHLTTANAQIIKTGVRSLTQCYVSVCEVVNKINNTDGLYMFLVYICLALITCSNGYQLVVALNTPSGTPYRWAEIIFQSNWCIMSTLRVFFFVEPFQRISARITEMKVLLAQLMYKMTPLGHHVSQDLDIMIKQVILNVPKYCPLGINTLNRSLVTITFNTIITFIVYLIQLQS